MTKIKKTNKLILINLIGDLLKKSFDSILKIFAIFIFALLLVGCKGSYSKEAKLSLTERVYSFYTYDITEKKLQSLVEILGYDDFKIKLVDKTLNIYPGVDFASDEDAALFEVSTIIMYLTPTIDEIYIHEDGMAPFSIERSAFKDLFYEFDRISEKNLESLFRSISLTSRSKVEVALAKSKLNKTFEKFKYLENDADYSAISYSVLGFIKENSVYNFYVYYRYSLFDLDSSIYEKDAKEALVKVGIKSNSLLSYEEVSNTLVSERDLKEEIKNTTDLNTISKELTKKNRDGAYEEYKRINSIKND